MLNELEDFNLPAEEKDEEIILLMRKHHFTLFWPFAKTLGIILLFVFIYLFFGLSSFTILVFFISLALAIYLIYEAFFIFKNDLYILTNKRIIDIDQKGFFNRSVAETDLEKIQNTKYEMKGLSQTFFNFGNVIIKTAGSQEGIILEKIANPYEVQQKIIEAQKNKANLIQNKPEEEKKKKGVTLR